MLCKAINKGDILEFDGSRKSWIISSNDGSLVGAPNMKIRIAPDMIFMCDDQGDLSILKSTLKYYKAERCLVELLSTFKMGFYFSNDICEKLDKDPSLSKDYHFINLYNQRASAVK